MPGLPPPKNNNNDKNKKNIVNNYKNNDNFNVDMVEGTFNNIFDFNKIINFNLESAIKDKLERKPDGNLIAFFKSSTKLYELIVNPNFKDNYSNYLTNKAVFEESTLDEICDNELKDIEKVKNNLLEKELEYKETIKTRLKNKKESEYEFMEELYNVGSCIYGTLNIIDKIIKNIQYIKYKI